MTRPLVALLTCCLVACSTSAITLTPHSDDPSRLAEREQCEMDLDAGDVKRAQADRIRARSPSNRRSGPNDVDIISNHLGVQ